MVKVYLGVQGILANCDSVSHPTAPINCNHSAGLYTVPSNTTTMPATRLCQIAIGTWRAKQYLKYRRIRCNSSSGCHSRLLTFSRASVCLGFTILTGIFTDDELLSSFVTDKEDTTALRDGGSVAEKDRMHALGTYRKCK